MQHKSIVDALKQLQIPYQEVEHDTFAAIENREERIKLGLQILQDGDRDSVLNDKRTMCAAFRNSNHSILLVGSVHVVARNLADLPCIKANKVQVKQLDWFGSGKSHTEDHNIELLTVTPSGSHNTFLGYTLQSNSLPATTMKVLPSTPRIGFVLGKESKYFERTGVRDFLRTAAGLVQQLHCIGCPAVAPNIEAHGVMPQEAFKSLLASSWFLIGVGDPIGSPSVLEAIQTGAVAIMRRFDEPQKIMGHLHLTQYDDLQRLATEQPALQNYTCSYMTQENLTECVKFATSYKRPPISISAFTNHSFVERFRSIFLQQYSNTTIKNKQ